MSISYYQLPTKECTLTTILLTPLERHGTLHDLLGHMALVKRFQRDWSQQLFEHAWGNGLQGGANEGSCEQELGELGRREREREGKRERWGSTKRGERERKAEVEKEIQTSVWQEKVIVRKESGKNE